VFYLFRASGLGRLKLFRASRGHPRPPTAGASWPVLACSSPVVVAAAPILPVVIVAGMERYAQRALRPLGYFRSSGSAAMWPSFCSTVVLLNRATPCAPACARSCRDLRARVQGHIGKKREFESACLGSRRGTTRRLFKISSELRLHQPGADLDQSNFVAGRPKGATPNAGTQGPHKLRVRSG